jgi:DNA-directed RNA polymerase I, II, and III subunit RPABC1
MLKDRGYVIPPDYTLSHKDFNTWVRKDDSKSIREVMSRLTFQNEAKKSISVFWRESLGIKDIGMIHQCMKDDNINHSIVVCTKITTYAVTTLRALRNRKMIIETFLEPQTSFVVVDNMDVPRHIICSEKTKKKMMEAYSVTKDQLPQIKATDPVCKYMGANKGQLIKIVRPSDSLPDVRVNGETKMLYDITYRIVV